MTLCIDETGVYYRVPICLINDPISYDADYQAQKLKNKEQPDEVVMTLRLRNPKLGDVTMEPSNLLSIESFKNQYIQKLGDKAPIGLNCSKIRMFAMGRELKDELFIYSYDIMNESTVQVMIRN